MLGGQFYWRENGDVTEVVILMGVRMGMLQKWSLEWTENGYVMEVFTLMEGE